MSDVLTQASGEEVTDFLASIERFVGDRRPLTRVRALLDDETQIGFDAAIWADQARLGCVDAMVPQDMGGFGLELQAAARMVEICGRHLTPEPVLSALCLATPVLLAQQCERSAQELRSLSAGECTIGVAVPSRGSLFEGALDVEAAADGDGWRLVRGQAWALDVPGVDRVLLPARTADGARWFVVDTGAVSAGVHTLIDGRRAARLDLAGCELAGDAALGAPAPVETVLRPVLTTGATLIGAWLLGVAEGAFALTLDYLKNRWQFGAPIGSYQGLQHRAARMFCDLEVARSTLEGACRALERGADDAPLLAHAARAIAGRTCLAVTGDAIQMHGGIGMTEEADVGLFFKAARVAEGLGGDSALHRALAARVLGIDDKEQQ